MIVFLKLMCSPCPAYTAYRLLCAESGYVRVQWGGLGWAGLEEMLDFAATFGLAANTSPKQTFIPWHTFEGETAKLFSF